MTVGVLTWTNAYIKFADSSKGTGDLEISAMSHLREGNFVLLYNLYQWTLSGARWNFEQQTT